MSSIATERSDRLWNLLPAYHREADAEAGYPLLALLRAIGERFGRVEADIDQLWNDLFIETCDAWVVPYLADLIGVEPILEIDGSSRLDVANTVRYKQTQGTLPMLERLAADVTGQWGAVVAEMFTRLSWSQHVNHLNEINRTNRGRTSVDLVEPAPLQLVDRAFDPHMHSIDLREGSTAQAHANLPNLAFFLSRMEREVFSNVSPRPASTAAGERRFFLHPLGVPTVLFHQTNRDQDSDRRTDEGELFEAIRDGWLYEQLREKSPPDERRLRFPDPEGVISLALDGSPVDADTTAESIRVRCANLADWREPPPDTIYLDVARGRLIFDEDHTFGTLPGRLTARFSSGVPGFVGAVAGRGPRLRGRDIRMPQRADARPRGWALLTVGDGETHVTLAAALEAWSATDDEKTLIRLVGSATVDGGVDIRPQAGRSLMIQCGPNDVGGDDIAFIDGDIRITGGETDAAGERMNLYFDGLWIAGRLRMTPAAQLDELVLLGSSIWALEHGEQGATPSTAQQAVDIEGRVARLTVSHCEVGGVRTGIHVGMAHIEDSIVDGHGSPALSGDGEIRSGAATRVDRSTFLGNVGVRSIDASDSIFLGRLVSRRTQVGCVRYSFVPLDSQTPRRYECEPDRTMERLRELNDGEPLSPSDQEFVERSVTPVFETLDPFSPAYALLVPEAPVAIATGASEGLEMGVWHHRKNPHRYQNLMRRLRDYMPFGLKPEIVYVN